MNIYNTLYFLEYSKDPKIEIYSSRYRAKIWFLNLSKKKYDYRHRYFDLPSYMRYYMYKIESIDYRRYTLYHRLIGPSTMDYMDKIKLYFINNKLMKKKTL